jgi:hypothetical protein
MVNLHRVVYRQAKEMTEQRKVKLGEGLQKVLKKGKGIQDL